LLKDIPKVRLTVEKLGNGSGIEMGMKTAATMAAMRVVLKEMAPA
jgi:hypothetical protein